jgi:hypothetical protein
MKNEYVEKIDINSNYRAVIGFMNNGTNYLFKKNFNNIYTSVIIVIHNNEPTRYIELYRYMVNSTIISSYTELNYSLTMNGKTINSKTLPEEIKILL